MPIVNVLVKANPSQGHEEEIIMEIVGSYSSLKAINKRASQIKVGTSNLMKPFLCSNCMLEIVCNPSINFTNYTAVTDILLAGFTAEITIIKALVVAQELEEQLPQAELLNSSLLPPSTPVTKLAPAKTDFKREEREKLLNVIKANMDIKIACESVVLLLKNQKDIDAAAKERFTNIAAYVRHQMRSCDYDFKTTDVIVHVSISEGTMHAKLVLSKVGDFDELTAKLDPRLATKIKLASGLKSLPTMNLQM
jgi:hypothetical protein